MVTQLGGDLRRVGGLEDGRRALPKPLQQCAQVVQVGRGLAVVRGVRGAEQDAPGSESAPNGNSNSRSPSKGSDGRQTSSNSRAADARRSRFNQRS